MLLRHQSPAKSIRAGCFIKSPHPNLLQTTQYQYRILMISDDAARKGAASSPAKVDILESVCRAMFSRLCESVPKHHGT